MKKLVITLTILFLVTGCAGIDYREMSDKVKTADWTKMQTITVSLVEHAFIPNILSLKVDTPYKLILKNDGNEKHYFVSEEFFKAIALRKVQSSDGEIKATYLTALEVYPKRALEVYFIPVKDGTYEFVCTIEGHMEKGMRGKITIENKKAEPGQIRYY